MIWFKQTKHPEEWYRSKLEHRPCQRYTNRLAKAFLRTFMSNHLKDSLKMVKICEDPVFGFYVQHICLDDCRPSVWVALVSGKNHDGCEDWLAQYSHPSTQSSQIAVSPQKKKKNLLEWFPLLTANSLTEISYFTAIHKPQAVVSQSHAVTLNPNSQVL